MKNDEKNFSLREGPTEAHISEEPVTESLRKKAQSTLDTRKDKKRLHSMHHGALSRFPLEALASLGENIQSLRKIERKLRAELKPSGIVAEILFDRLWASYLRCLLAARAEALAVVSVNQPAGLGRPASFLREATFPTLVTQDCATDHEVLAPEIFRQLVLVERYDRHFSREMYRALALLLIQRDGGEAGVQQCIGKLVGLNRDPLEGSKDA